MPWRQPDQGKHRKPRQQRAHRIDPSDNYEAKLAVREYDKATKAKRAAERKARRAPPLDDDSFEDAFTQRPSPEYEAKLAQRTFGVAEKEERKAERHRLAEAWRARSLASTPSNGPPAQPPTPPQLLSKPPPPPCPPPPTPPLCEEATTAATPRPMPPAKKPPLPRPMPRLPPPPPDTKFPWLPLATQAQLAAHFAAEVRRINAVTKCDNDWQVILGVYELSFEAAQSNYRCFAWLLHPDRRTEEGEALAGGKGACDRAYLRVHDAHVVAESLLGGAPKAPPPSFCTPLASQAAHTSTSGSSTQCMTVAGGGAQQAAAPRDEPAAASGSPPAHCCSASSTSARSGLIEM